jgi:hypothetical protein
MALACPKCKYPLGSGGNRVRTRNGERTVEELVAVVDEEDAGKMISAFGTCKLCSSMIFVMKLGAYAKP